LAVQVLQLLLLGQAVVQVFLEWLWLAVALEVQTQQVVVVLLVQ
jgi:hypothetical protein